MQRIQTLVLVGFALLLAACGSNSNNTINGNWTAALMSGGSNSSPVFNFSVTLAASGGSNLSVTNLNFTTANSCFTSGSTATGGFTLSGNMNGVTAGGFQMSIQSAPNGGNNLLTLQGTVNNNTVTGNWTLTGTTAGCTGSGSFTMNKG
ncbi:MAG: hypothetical protein JO356_15280 [Acidobacteria bacterium]|nr:hypothetical protein [Acidobacteriota bacterium]